MFQLHPGCIYVSSFSIIFLASGPTQICSFTLPPLLHSPPLRYPPAMLWLQHDVGTWRVPKEVQPLKPLKKVKVQRASCLCRWAPFNVWTSPAVTTRSSPNSQESPHIHIYWIWVNFHKNQRFMGRVTRDIWGHQSCHGPEVARLTSPSVRNGKLNGWAWKNPIANAGTPTHFLEIECT